MSTAAENKQLPNEHADKPINTQAAAQEEQAVKNIRNCVLWESAKREIYISALKRIATSKEPVERAGLEEFMLALPESATMHQAPGTLIDALVKCGALEEQAPEPVFDQDTQEYYVDRSRAIYTLTYAGSLALESLGTSVRMQAVIEQEPEFKDSYMSLLSFCSEQARTRKEIDELLDDICAAQPNPANVTRYGVYASYFTDKLQASGALVWQNGWTATEEGKALLKAFQ